MGLGYTKYFFAMSGGWRVSAKDSPAPSCYLRALKGLGLGFRV